MFHLEMRFWIALETAVCSTIHGSSYRRNGIAIFIVAILFACCCLSAANAAEIMPRCIVIPKDAMLVEKFAAEELQYHIKQATGSVLPIHEENLADTPSAPAVYLGKCSASREAGLNRAELTFNGYVITNRLGNLYLWGNDTEGDPLLITNGVGTLFAVYDLLETSWDIRWLWPGELGEIIPKRDEVWCQRSNQTDPPRVTSN